MTARKKFPTHAPANFATTLNGIVRGGEDLLATLAALESNAQSSGGSRRDPLVHVVTKIEAMANALESAGDELTRAEAQMWLDRFEILLDAWARFQEQLDQAIAQAIAGTVERGLLFLSLLVNGTNFAERKRLKELCRRLADELHDSTGSQRLRDQDQSDDAAHFATLDIEFLSDPMEPSQLEHFASDLSRASKDNESDIQLFEVK